MRAYSLSVGVGPPRILIVLGSYRIQLGPCLFPNQSTRAPSPVCVSPHRTMLSVQFHRGGVFPTSSGTPLGDLSFSQNAHTFSAVSRSLCHLAVLGTHTPQALLAHRTAFTCLTVMFGALHAWPHLSWSQITNYHCPNGSPECPLLAQLPDFGDPGAPAWNVSPSGSLKPAAWCCSSPPSLTLQLF